jgi:hypothetical protein
VFKNAQGSSVDFTSKFDFECMIPKAKKGVRSQMPTIDEEASGSVVEGGGGDVEGKKKSLKRKRRQTRKRERRGFAGFSEY